MSNRAAEADKHGEGLERTTKMARVGRKYAALFELAALAGSEAPSEEWVSRLLRLMSSAGWADPSFLEELSESGLVRGMCRALPVLKANAANRAAASSVQDLADLEESVRKLRHELALAEKRLPSHGVLGAGGSAVYTTWASVGHVCTLMLQALTYSIVPGQPLPAVHARSSPAPMDAAASPAPLGGVPGDSAATPRPAGAGEAPSGQTVDVSSLAATPAAAAGGAAAAAAGSPGTSTPRGGAPLKPPGGGAASSPGISGSSTPALATEAALLKLMGNKHVVAHAKEVMRVVPEPYKATLARILLTQISTEMKATQSGLVLILQILQGDPAATSPAPATLPKAWFTTATLLAAYNDTLRVSRLATGPGAADADAVASGAAFSAAANSPAAGPAPPEPEDRAADLANGEHAPQTATPGALDASSASNLAPPATGSAAGANGDVEMAEAPAAEGGGLAAGRAEEPAEPGPGSDAAGGTGSSSAPATPPARKGAGGAKSDSAVGSPSDAAAGGARAAAVAAATAATVASADDDDNDPRVGLVQLLQNVASALCEAVTGAHGVGRMALLLRGEAAAKFSHAASFMPAALSINELVGHLDGLACVATALGASDVIRPSVASLLTSQAMKELLGAGKVYVTTVIAAGALTRDLAIDAVIPQSLRQGYMTAVLTPLETGALLNERRAPQVLAYRNSITESSYYQVMDAEALPYGVNVRFEDEQEAEGMGVVREWLSQVAADIFSLERGLFVRGAADMRAVHPSSHSRLQEDHLGYMRFAGRIVGLALRANVPLGVVLSTGLFNYLTGRRATLQDLQQIDPQVHTTCQNILSSPGAEALELFHVWHVSHGSSGSGGGGGEQEQELLPGGAALLVTDANKADYVTLLAHHVVVTVVEEQCAAFLAGVQDTAHHLPDDVRLRRAFLAPLLLEDLNRITAGESTLDLNDWAGHTDAAGFEGPEEQGSLDMFWQLVSEYSAEDRQRLLQFWTAMTHLPSGGFKALNQRLQVMKLGPPAARPAAPAPAGDRPGDAAAAAAAAATPTANGHGPSSDGAGPRSHRIDGDSLEVEEQDQSDGMEEAAEEAELQRAQRQQQQGGGSAAVPAGTPPAGGGGGDDGSLREPSDGDAAPAAEADLSGSQGAAAAASPRAGGSAATAAGGAAHGGGASGGDDVDMPYGEEDDEAGTGEDYGGEGDEEVEDEDEEFQRQLEMALALSLQDMSAEPAQGSSESAAGAGGAGSSSAGAGEGGEGAAGAADEGASEAAAAPAASMEPAAQPGGDSAQQEQPGEQAAGAVPRAADATDGLNDAAGAASASTGGSGAEPPPASPPATDRIAAEGASPPAPVLDSSGGDGAGGAAAGTAPTPVEAANVSSSSHRDGIHNPVGCEPAAEEDGVRPVLAGVATAAGGAAAGGAGEAGSSRVGEGPGGRDGSRLRDDGADAERVPAPQRLGGELSALEDAMDTDGGRQGAVSNTAPDADGAVAVGNGEDAGPAATGGTDAGPAATAADPPGGSAGGDGNQRTDWAAASDQGQEREGAGLLLPQEQGHGLSGSQESEQEQRQAGGLRQEQGQEDGVRQQLNQEAEHGGRGMQEGGAQQAAAAPAADVEDRADGGGSAVGTGGSGSAVGAGGSGGGDAALTSSQPLSRCLPLLPQSRTCFLQLNLPVYSSLDDMRRAFAIALDNMSFGLH